MSDQLENSKAEFLNEFYKKLSEEVLIAYRGTFERDVLSVLANNIENSIDDNSVIKRKFFKIFLELAQNISRFAVEQVEISEYEKSGSGLFIIKHDSKSYYLVSGNIIINKDINKLSEIINLINSLDRQGMRNYKREQFKLNSNDRDSSLGIVQMALISNKQIAVLTKKIDADYSFAIISIEISK